MEKEMHPNAVLLKRFYNRDRSALFDNMHPDYKNHTPGNNPIAGSHAGPEGMMKHFEDHRFHSGGTFRAQHQDVFLADDVWGYVPVRLTAERNGKKLDMLAFGVWRFIDGKFVDHWENPTDLKAFDEFWA